MDNKVFVNIDNKKLRYKTVNNDNITDTLLKVLKTSTMASQGSLHWWNVEGIVSEDEGDRCKIQFYIFQASITEPQSIFMAFQ